MNKGSNATKVMENNGTIEFLKWQTKAARMTAREKQLWKMSTTEN